jgi:glycosyltransferase involved in cell wall biosynthesis
LKIAYLSPTGALGGAESCLLDLLASTRALRPDQESRVILGGDGPLRSEVERLGIACEIVELPETVARLGDAGLAGRSAWSKLARLGLGGLRASLGTLAYARELSRRVAAFGPDLVQTNGMKMHLLAAWSTPRRLPLVWHLHDYLGSRAAMGRLLSASKRPGLVGVGVSGSVTFDARRVLGPDVELHTIHNRIDIEHFRDHVGPGEGRVLDEAAGVASAPDGTVRVGLVATFAIWKGHEVFLEAIARIPRELPARFYVIGGPIYRSTGSQVELESLRSHAEVLGVSDRVVFTGRFDDPAPAIRGLDVVVHASTRPEPFGRVIVEGMASGRAVVAIRDGGSAELFEDGVSALGAESNDPGSLASAVERLIRSPELRAKLGREGRRVAVARFDRSLLAEDWASIHAGALARRSDRAASRPAAEISGTRRDR